MRCNRGDPEIQSLSPGEKKKSSVMSKRKIFELSTIQLEDQFIQVYSASN